MSSRRLILTFGLLTGLFAAGYGVMFTMLDDFRAQYGIGPTALGGIVAMGFFASFLAQTLIAPMADRGHARALVFAGMIFEIVGLLGMAAGRHVMALLVSRFIMGIGAGMAVPAVRRIVILAQPDRLGSNLGALLSADVGGFAFGPVISAFLVKPFGIPAPFLVMAVATAACLPVIMRVKVDETAAADVESTRFAFDLLRNKAYLAAVALGSAAFLMIGTFDSMWALVLRDLHASDWISNIGITLFALPLIVLGSIGGRLAQRVGPFRLGTIGILFGALFMFLYGRLPSGGAMLVVGMFHAVNDGLTISGTGVAVGIVVEPERQAGAQGLLGGVQTLVGGLTAITAGFLYQHAGRTTAYSACAAAMVALTATSMSLLSRERSRRSTSPVEAVAVG